MPTLAHSAVGPLTTAPPSAPYSFGFGEQQPRPPPIHVDYGVYGIGVTADILADAGASCPLAVAPCILGSGGGLVFRGGYRSPGPWYIGGAYQFSKTDSSNLYNLGILQQLRAEMRYMLDMGFRTSPFATWGIGGVVYGNEWGVETGGGTLFGGVGFETELSRLALLGLAVVYQPVLLAGFTDTAQHARPLGLAQFVRVELQFEIRSELPRR
ncbi:MAG TPA: hypothetical protein ENK23_04540 [Sorangium sp.]|nr:hypothetical protein [Sorangium sp.]